MKGLIADFGMVGLDELNGKAALLERTDNKYVLNKQQLVELLNYTKNDFDALMIDGCYKFRYRSVYFDSELLCTFKHHNQGRRNRIKVRRRHYLECDLHYFEVKLKGLRNRTHKYRFPISREVALSSTLSPDEIVFLQRKYSKYYKREWPSMLVKSIAVDYQRVTLVARAGGERLTIDQNIQFVTEDQVVSLPMEYRILEVKSDSGYSEVDRWLIGKGIRPVARCSKYSMGISLLKYPRNNKFNPVLKYKFKIVSSFNELRGVL